MFVLSDIAHIGYHLSILTSAMAEVIGSDADRQIDMAHVAASEAVAVLVNILALIPAADLTPEEKLTDAALYAAFEGFADYDLA